MDRVCTGQQGVWWAREELNLRPLPCQQNTGNRCARRHCCRSRLTVGVEVKRSLRVQLSALLRQEGSREAGWPAGRRSLLPGQRCSQLVTLSDPIVPVLDRLAGLLVHGDALQLGQRNRKGSAVPAD